MGRRVSFRRLLSALVFAVAVAIVFVPGASAGSIADFDPRPRGSNGDLVCPVGKVGVNYSIKFHGDEVPICSPGDDQWYATNGSVPRLFDAGVGRHAFGNAHPRGRLLVLAGAEASGHGHVQQ